MCKNQICLSGTEDALTVTNILNIFVRISSMKRSERKGNSQQVLFTVSFEHGYFHHCLKSPQPPRTKPTGMQFCQILLKCIKIGGDGEGDNQHPLHSETLTFLEKRK